MGSQSEYLFVHPEGLKRPNLKDFIWTEPFPPDYSRFGNGHSWDILNEEPEVPSEYIYDLETTLGLISEDTEGGILDPEVFFHNLYSVTDRFIGTIEQKGGLKLGDFYAYLSSRLSPILEYFSEQAEEEYVERYFFGLIAGVEGCLVFFHNELIHKKMLDHSERLDSPQRRFLNELIVGATIENFYSSPVKNYSSAIATLNRFETERGKAFMLQELTILYRDASFLRDYRKALKYLSDARLIGHESLYALHEKTWREKVVPGVRRTSSKQMRECHTTEIAHHVFDGLTRCISKRMGHTASEGDRVEAIRKLLDELNTSIEDLERLGFVKVVKILAAQ